jgi:hypothetical protein
MKKLFASQIISNLIFNPTTSIETFEQLSRQIDTIIPYINPRGETAVLISMSNDTTLRTIQSRRVKYLKINEIIPKQLDRLINGKAVLIDNEGYLSYLIRIYPQIKFKLSSDRNHQVYRVRFAISRESIHFENLLKM